MMLLRHWWFIAATLATAFVVGIAVVWQPVPSVIAITGLFALTLGIVFAGRVARLFLTFLAICLVGYAYSGKGFAYIGVPPIYVGEMALASGLLALAVNGGLLAAFRSPISQLLIAFCLWGAAQTAPYFGEYGVNALRDAAIWGYGAFAFFIAALFLRTGAHSDVPEAYRRWFWWFPFWVPVGVAISRKLGDALPMIPGSGVTIFLPKFGDVGVHLAGVGAFCLLGLQRVSEQPTARKSGRMEWAWWAAWLMGAAIVAAANRAGGVAAVLGLVTVVLLRPIRTKWWKPALIAVVMAAAFAGSGVSIDLGIERKLSAQQILSNMHSIGGGTQEATLEGSREWRLQWWSDISAYTLHGPYFWTGKGYGVNLADDDAHHRGDPEGLTRSPHNAQLTILARAGVPGLCLWLLLQGTFALSLILAYLRAQRAKWDWWARVNLWILAYWVAFIVNGSFDVYLEGPQGGIWFWSVFGFGIAALEAQRRQHLDGSVNGRSREQSRI